MNNLIKAMEIGIFNVTTKARMDELDSRKAELEAALPLDGAKFRIRYADPNVSAQVWTLTTGGDGIIYIDLPHEGTLIIEELEAPAGYVIGQIYTWEVVVAKGEHKVVDISNDKKADIIVYKKDAQTGQLLSGATIKPKLLITKIGPRGMGKGYHRLIPQHTEEPDAHKKD